MVPWLANTPIQPALIFRSIAAASMAPAIMSPVEPMAAILWSRAIVSGKVR